MARKPKPIHAINLAPPRKSPTRWVMGLDLSLNSTGVVVARAKDALGAITIRSGEKLRGAERLAFLSDAILGLLREASTLHGCPPVLVAIEGYAFCARSQAVLGELGGVIRLMLHREGVAWVEVPPMTLKQFITGKGNSRKEEVMLAVFKRWGWSPANNDIADAYGLAAFAAALSGMPWNSEAQGHWDEPLPVWQAAVIERFKKNRAEKA